MSPELLKKLDYKISIIFKPDLESNLFSIGIIFIKAINNLKYNAIR